MSKAKKPVRQNKKGFVMPEPIPCGEILTDMLKKQWKIGPSIGKGGFGEIYSACENGSSVKPDKYPYVVKIEPHENGPLFVEMHFYMRNAKKEDIDSFCKSHKLEDLGMPIYIASGSHALHNGNKYRFLVMQRFMCDLQSYLKEAKTGLPEHTVLRLGLQMSVVLEYIHSRTYVHADLKAANILLSTALNQAYLVDFGLASHYNTKAFKPDPKKMHNGTIEYTSRDAHLGVPTRRGDFEILAYNLIHWLGGILPWDKNLSNPVTVQNLKNEAASDITKFLKQCFSKQAPPKFLTEFVKIVFEMNNDAEPPYAKFKTIFESGLKALGKSNKGKLDFGKTLNDSVNKSLSSPRARAKKVLSESDHVTEEPKLKKTKLNISNKKNVKENGCASDHEIELNSPSKRTPLKKATGSRLAALKKTNNILEYSICEDEDVEIIVKKTNVKTGEVKTTIKKQKCETDSMPLSVRQSPRLTTRDKKESTASSELDSSYEENKSPKKIAVKRNVAKAESNWKNCATIKASKAGAYLKKSKSD